MCSIMPTLLTLDRRQEDDFGDNTDNEVEVLDIETDWKLKSTLILILSGCLPPLNVSAVKSLSLSTDD